MVKDVEVLAIIPARGGSKSIPFKNIKALGGISLIAYSIAAALQAQVVNRVLVSTDDEDIAQIAYRWGAEVPFMRPGNLAEDDTPDLPVFQHTLQWLEKNEGYKPEIVVHLRPTSPFRKIAHINRAVTTLQRNAAASAVRTVCTPFQNPYKMWRIGQDEFLTPLLDGPGAEPYNMPRQELPVVYWQTGYVDVARSSTILELQSMTGPRILPLIIGASETIDLDSPEDWVMAEYFINSGQIRISELGFSLSHPPASK